jgi:AcrR family transcriptional regulator
MNDSSQSAPLRSHARSNRARLLEQARRLLALNPDSSLDEIAAAAGVARRTLYGHFAGRPALIEALVQEASASLTAALATVAVNTPEPEVDFARFVVAIWPIGDRYRILLALGERQLGADRVRELIDPANQRAIEILTAGQQTGVFQNAVPAPVLNEALSAMNVALLASVNDGVWDGDRIAAATTLLIAAGVPAERARAISSHG